MLFLRVAGCRVGCRFCDTPHSWPKASTGWIRDGEGRREGARPFANPVSAHEVIAWAAAFRAARPGLAWASLTGGEPLEQPAFAAALARGLRATGWKVFLETAGIHAAALRRVRPHADFVSMDWKLEMGKAARHRAFLRALGRTPAQVKAVVRAGTPAGEVAEAARAVASARPDTALILQPVTPIGRLAPPDAGELEGLRREAARWVGEVRILGQAHRPGARGAHRPGGRGPAFG